MARNLLLSLFIMVDYSKNGSFEAEGRWSSSWTSDLSNLELILNSHHALPRMIAFRSGLSEHLLVYSLC